MALHKTVTVQQIANGYLVTYNQYSDDYNSFDYDTSNINKQFYAANGSQIAEIINQIYPDELAPVAQAI